MAEPTQILESIRSCKNVEGGTLPEGAVVVISDTQVGAREVEFPANADSVLYGVVVNGDIADDDWGDVCIRGVVECNAEGALATKGVRLGTTALGRVAAHATTDSVIGTLLTEAASQDDKVLVELAGPGQAGI